MAVSERTVVWFGNPNPQMTVTDRVPLADGGYAESSRQVPAEHLNQSVTSIELWDGFDDPDRVALTLSTDNQRELVKVSRLLPPELQRYVVGVHEVEVVLGTHAAAATPDWVSSTDPEFAAALADYFGCPVGDPVMLLTNAGRDVLHDQHMKSSGQPAGVNYLGLTASTGAIAATDTSLPGEITTTGLARAQATYAHTAGTNTSTLTKTFTAVAADVTGGNVVVAQLGAFNAAGPPVAGTLAYRTALATTATISATGDSLTVTETLNLG